MTKYQKALKAIADVAFDGTKSRKGCRVDLANIILEAKKMLDALNKKGG